MTSVPPAPITANFHPHPHFNLESSRECHKFTTTKLQGHLMECALFSSSMWKCSRPPHHRNDAAVASRQPQIINIGPDGPQQYRPTSIPRQYRTGAVSFRPGPRVLDILVFKATLIKLYPFTANPPPPALGMVIFEVLSGEAPFAADKDVIVMRKVIEGDRPERPEVAWFTDGLWSTLRQCWWHEPKDRLSVEAALERLMQVSDTWQPIPSTTGDGEQG